MYVKVEGGTAKKYVLSHVKSDFPSVSFPKNVSDETLAEHGIFPAVVGPIPDHDLRTQVCYVEETATLVDGVWTFPQVVINRTPEEIKGYDDNLAYQARAKRDSWLAKSDWVVTKALETGTDIPADWAAYRQALRDITAQEGFPNTIDWPESP
jgi:hypothetical protein